jgi:hypothetical protein
LGAEGADWANQACKKVQTALYWYSDFSVQAIREIGTIAYSATLEACGTKVSL